MNYKNHFAESFTMRDRMQSVFLKTEYQSLHFLHYISDTHFTDDDFKFNKKLRRFDLTSVCDSMNKLMNENVFRRQYSINVNRYKFLIYSNVMKGIFIVHKEKVRFIYNVCKLGFIKVFLFSYNKKFAKVMIPRQKKKKIENIVQPEVVRIGEQILAHEQSLQDLGELFQKPVTDIHIKDVSSTVLMDKRGKTEGFEVSQKIMNNHEENSEMIPLKTTTDFIKTSAEDLNAIMEYNEVTKSPNYNEFTRDKTKEILEKLQRGSTLFDISKKFHKPFSFYKETREVSSEEDENIAGEEIIAEIEVHAESNSLSELPGTDVPIVLQEIQTMEQSVVPIQKTFEQVFPLIEQQPNITETHIQQEIAHLDAEQQVTISDSRNKEEIQLIVTKGSENAKINDQSRLSLITKNNSQVHEMLPTDTNKHRESISSTNLIPNQNKKILPDSEHEIKFFREFVEATSSSSDETSRTTRTRKKPIFLSKKVVNNMINRKTFDKKYIPPMEFSEYLYSTRSNLMDVYRLMNDNIEVNIHDIMDTQQDYLSIFRNEIDCSGPELDSFVPNLLSVKLRNFEEFSKETSVIQRFKDLKISEENPLDDTMRKSAIGAIWSRPSDHISQPHVSIRQKSEYFNIDESQFQTEHSNVQQHVPISFLEETDVRAPRITDLLRSTEEIDQPAKDTRTTTTVTELKENEIPHTKEMLVLPNRQGQIFTKMKQLQKNAEERQDFSHQTSESSEEKLDESERLKFIRMKEITKMKVLSRIMEFFQMNIVPFRFSDLCPKNTTRDIVAKTFRLILSLHAEKKIFVERDIHFNSSESIIIFPIGRSPSI